MTEFSSAKYWEDRYAAGHGSGAGSRGAQAAFKADFINRFVREHGVTTVIEYGCGDGYQLSLAEYPSYVGLDVSETALDLCRARFADDRAKIFTLYGYPRRYYGADLALSLDVLYHLVEDDVYDRYLEELFAASSRWVILYTSDLDHPDTTNEGMAAHMRHRHVPRDVERRFPQWKQIGDLIPHGMDGAWFFVYEYRP